MTQTFGEQVVGSEGFHALKERGTDGRFLVSCRIDDDDLLKPTPLTARFGTGTTVGNALALARETVVGGKVTFTAETRGLEKVRAIIKVSTEMLEDSPAVRAYLDKRMLSFLAQADEGYEVGALRHEGHATLRSWFAPTRSRRSLLRAAMRGCKVVRREGGLDPDTVVVSMATYAKTSTPRWPRRFTKSPLVPASLLKDWGCDLMASRQLGDDEVLVGAFKQGATVWAKKGIGVDVSNGVDPEGRDFVDALTAIRAEHRVLLHVQRPQAFCWVRPR